MTENIFPKNKYSSKNIFWHTIMCGRTDGFNHFNSQIFLRNMLCAKKPLNTSEQKTINWDFPVYCS